MSKEKERVTTAADLTKITAEEVDIDYPTVEMIMDCMADVILSELKKGKSVSFGYLGTFFPKRKKGRMQGMAKKGMAVYIPEHTCITFRTSRLVVRELLDDEQ